MRVRVTCVGSVTRKNSMIKQYASKTAKRMSAFRCPAGTPIQRIDAAIAIFHRDLPKRSPFYYVTTSRI